MRTTGPFLHFSQQWTSLFGKCNWYDFTFIHAEVEYAPYTDRFELTLAFMGLWLNFQYVYDTKFTKRMEAQIASLPKLFYDNTYECPDCEHRWTEVEESPRETETCSHCLTENIHPLMSKLITESDRS